ncbi:MAG: hypothetical protein WCK91_00125 [bacterium]
MDYNRITDFLCKFKKLLSSNEEVYSAVSLTVYHYSGVKLENKNIKVNGASISIQGSPIQKSQVLIYKKNILDDLSKILPDSHFVDIR